MNNYSRSDEMLDRWVKGDIALTDLSQEMGWTKEESVLQATLHKAAVQSISYAAIQRQVNAVHRTFIYAKPESSEKPVVRTIPVYRWAMRIAASLIVMLGLYMGQQLFFASSTELYHNFFQDYSTVTERSAANYESSSLIDAFRKKDYSKVLVAFETGSSLSNREKFFAGYANLQLDKPQDAIALFEEVLQFNKLNNGQFYQDEAEYYQAVAYLKAGNKKAAYKLLSAIRNNPLHTYHDSVSRWELLRLKWSSLGKD